MTQTVCEARVDMNAAPQSVEAVEALGERIALLAAQISAATYELLTMLREFDERGGWNCGFRSCAHWLNWRAGIDLGAAREKVRVARALAVLPCLSESMRRGEVSYAKVRALTRIATPANEAELLSFARAGTAAHVERLVRGMRRVDRIEEREHEQRRDAGRYLRMHADEDGMLVVSARLSPEAGAALLRAIEAGVESLYGRSRREEAREAAGGGDEPTAEQRRADALGVVAESALSGGLDPGTRGDRYQVVVHVDAEALTADGDGSATLADGTHVSAETCRRIACDAAVVTMRHALDGSVLDVGRRTRAISPALRRALDHRDRGCRFPGCGLKLCDAHHVQHWADGGKTKLANTLLLCRRHHRAVHEEGFRVELLASGAARFYRPNGHRLVDAPLVSFGGAEATLACALAARGVVLAAESTLPSWDGGEVDYGWEIDWLRSLDRGRLQPPALPPAASSAVSSALA